ncbi:MAG: 30S ribosomal protein S8 [Flavobacteriales bacterium]|nr:30S ribosomal protein S8 [Flavobacteriales bacterium]
MTTDPIADLLTRMRNAMLAGHKVVDVPSSKIKVEIAKILKEQGYIRDYKVEEDNKQGVLRIALKYNAKTKMPAIKKLERVSRPGLRQYSNAEKMPRVLNGLGIAIVSTSNGVMTNKMARQENVGGEVLCYVY